MNPVWEEMLDDGSLAGYRQVVIAPPPGLMAWSAWEDGTVDGPYPVLALAFDTRVAAGPVRAIHIERSRRNGTRYTTTDYRAVDAVAEFATGDEPFEWGMCWVYLALDWEEPRWLRHGDNACFTQGGAEERAAHLKEFAEARAARDAAEAPA